MNNQSKFSGTKRKASQQIIPGKPNRKQYNNRSLTNQFHFYSTIFNMGPHFHQNALYYLSTFSNYSATHPHQRQNISRGLPQNEVLLM